MIRNRSGFLAVDYIMVMAIILLLILLFTKIADRSMQNSRRLSCLSNIAQLGQGLQMYAQDYNGHFPPRTNDLRPVAKSSMNRDICLCPSDKGSPADRKDTLYSSYSYNGGHRNDDSPNTPLIADAKACHMGLHNVYYLGGSTVSVPKERWKPFAPAPKMLPMKSEPDPYEYTPPPPPAPISQPPHGAAPAAVPSDAPAPPVPAAPGAPKR